MQYVIETYTDLDIRCTWRIGPPQPHGSPFRRKARAIGRKDTPPRRSFPGYTQRREQVHRHRRRDVGSPVAPARAADARAPDRVWALARGDARARVAVGVVSVFVRAIL